jgi:Tol biopolymer transport system component
MGDVYQATDSKLGRSVAIKLLPDAFARDAERVARFEQEARILASLNHANIAAIYGVEHSGTQNFLVMELVKGETLAQRIQHGPVPLEETLHIAKQIAEALEAAHDKGVVHRDLKPANIKITTDGKVKVLDFGLAKAYVTGGSSPELSNSPTLIGAASMPGTILGTAAYMSPEQAKGRNVDKRTDIFAFGCVVYEMLTGKRVFDGEDASDILSAVLRTEPDWASLPANLPPRVREMLELCLEKDPRRRRRDAGDLILDIERATAAADVKVDGRPPASANSRIAWAVSAVLAIGLAVATAVFVNRRFPEAPEVRLDITTPSTPAPLEFALSPDGRYIVFIASGEGPQRLWLRALDKAEAKPIAGSESGDFPFWSPDSRSIGFTASGKLKKVDIAGGLPQVIANTTFNRGASWGPDGTILFNASSTAIFRVSASSGEPVAITKLDLPRISQHRFPHFLPDGRHFLFYAVGTPEAQGIYLGSLDGSEPKRLAQADTGAVYFGDGYVAFMRQTTLIAQHLDVQRGELTGDPVKIAESVGANGINSGAFSVSSAGLIAYRTGSDSLRQFRWYDRAGKALGDVGQAESTIVIYPELSLDRSRLAMQRLMQGNTDVWLMDLLRGSVSRLTFDPAIDGAPVWSPDGSRLVFLSGRKGIYDLYLKSSNGGGEEQLLLQSPNDKYPQSWSSDGRYLLYGESDSKTGRDLFALPITGTNVNSAERIVVAHTPFDELNGQFSPDGRWVAYETNESGRFEVVVQPFPAATAKWQVSTAGGTQPRWKPDGKELYYVTPETKLMAVPLAISNGTVMPGAPVMLFPVRLSQGFGANKQEYDVSRGGRFLLDESIESPTPTPITVIMNWKPK